MNSGKTKERIILAEDDADMADILSFWLNGEGYDVTVVSDGWSCIEEARKGEYDGAILDLLMPGVDGYQACRYIRHDKDMKDLPIILFSAVFIDEEEKQLGYEAGADEFVMKTSGFNALLHAIDRVVRNGNKKPRKRLEDESAAIIKAEVDQIVKAS